MDPCDAVLDAHLGVRRGSQVHHPPLREDRLHRPRDVLLSCSFCSCCRYSAVQYKHSTVQILHSERCALPATILLYAVLFCSSLLLGFASDPHSSCLQASHRPSRLHLFSALIFCPLHSITCVLLAPFLFESVHLLTCTRHSSLLCSC